MRISDWSSDVCSSDLVAMRQGEVERREPERRPAPTMLKPVPSDMGESLRDIGDPELRAVLVSLAQGLATSSGLPKIESRCSCRTTALFLTRLFRKLALAAIAVVLSPTALAQRADRHNR